MNIETTTNITDRVKTFQDACILLDMDYAKEMADMEGTPKDEAAYRQLKIIAQALNQGWKPDWANKKWDKYYPWFNMSGSGLALFTVDYQDTVTSVGSRLCFKSRGLAEYAATQFLPLYTDLFII
jgi:hypothetical protein